MKGIRYTDEFKAEAIKQITERGHSHLKKEKTRRKIYNTRDALKAETFDYT